mmetsp:Transcript_63081/g.188013  ORF Transcript_63081/g.188013 Transcript_63081/m.188013 type:complete len:206 (-) Transcript_63081:73-690(-)
MHVHYAADQPHGFPIPDTLAEALLKVRPGEPGVCGELQGEALPKRQFRATGPVWKLGLRCHGKSGSRGSDFGAGEGANSGRFPYSCRAIREDPEVAPFTHGRQCGDDFDFHWWDFWIRPGGVRQERPERQELAWQGPAVLRGGLPGEGHQQRRGRLHGRPAGRGRELGVRVRHRARAVGLKATMVSLEAGVVVPVMVLLRFTVHA